MPRKRPIKRISLVSGQAGLVVVINGPACTFRRIGQIDYLPCRRHEIPYLFGDAFDIISISGKSPAQVSRILENEWSQNQSLHLILILLSTAAHLHARELASDALEGLLAGDATKEFVLHRLYSRPLPETSDTTDALQRCVEAGRKTLWAILTRLRGDQSKISEVRDRWDRLDPDLFGGSGEKRIFEQIAVEEGFFYVLCQGQISSTEHWTTNPRLEQFQNRKHIMEAWAGIVVVPRQVAREDQLDLAFGDSSIAC
jgi:hypothetical protein